MTFELANFTDPSGMIVYASSVTGGWFWVLMLGAVWIVGFGSLSGFTTTERAFSAVSFFTGILSGVLFVMGAMDTLPTVIFTTLAIAGFIMLLFSKD